jgi:hypothetical protein
VTTTITDRHCAKCECAQTPCECAAKLRQMEAIIGFALNCLRSHHMTRGGIGTLVRTVERKLKEVKP